MAQLTTVKRVMLEDLKGAPEWVSPFLTAFNTFQEQVYNAINRNLTFAENSRAVVKELKFTTDASYSTGTWVDLRFQWGFTQKPTGAIIIQAAPTAATATPIKEAVTVTWAYDGTGQIIIQWVSGLANSTEYNVRFLVF